RRALQNVTPKLAPQKDRYQAVQAEQTLEQTATVGGSYAGPFLAQLKWVPFIVNIASYAYFLGAVWRWFYCIPPGEEAQPQTARGALRRLRYGGLRVLRGLRRGGPRMLRGLRRGGPRMLRHVPLLRRLARQAIPPIDVPSAPPPRPNWAPHRPQ